MPGKPALFETGAPGRCERGRPPGQGSSGAFAWKRAGPPRHRTPSGQGKPANLRARCLLRTRCSHAMGRTRP
eukprot:9430585-Pyramimonas_sp.AAC.1